MLATQGEDLSLNSGTQVWGHMFVIGEEESGGSPGHLGQPV